MKILIEGVSMTRPATLTYGRVFDPDWKWTSARGREYSIVNDSVFPEPEVRTVCVSDTYESDDEDWECDDYSEWEETRYYDPDTGEEIHPRRQTKAFIVSGMKSITGTATIEGCSPSDIEDLIFGGSRSLSDPEVILPSQMQGASGEFFFQRITGDGHADLAFTSLSYQPYAGF